MQNRVSARLLRRLGPVLAVALLTGPAESAQQSTPEQAVRFGKSYQELKPPQRRLIDDWVARFNRTMGRELDPEEVYDSAPVSVRSTFEAVTHALMTTPLTDAEGRPMGTALDLVARLDAVHGKIRRARGDLQFRIYATLAPDAKQKLAACREFSRRGDNTIYHKGYPINYRQDGGVPSIQISIARASNDADIDVDYRSSRFPAALVNGHLTAANSDVRAGNNYDRHVGRWQGLANWWRSLFGLPMKEAAPVDLSEEEAQLAAMPRKRRAKVEESVADFLRIWLLEQNPMEAIGYFSERSHDCVALSREGDVDRGMIRYEILRALMGANDELGKPARLEDVLTGVRISYDGLRLVKQPHHAQFVVFEVPDDIAYDSDCGNRLRPQEAGPRPPRRYGNYYAVVFRIHAPDKTGETLLTLWNREKGYWKIVSFELEPGGSRLTLERARQSGAEAAHARKETQAAPAGFVKAHNDFLEAWLLRRNAGKAVSYFAPSAAACYNLLRDPDSPPARNEKEARRRLKEAMAELAAALPAAGSLEDLIEAVAYDHPDLLPIRNPHPRAYALAAVPQHLAEGMDCRKRASGEEFSEGPVPTPRYGRYYGSSFQLRNTPGDPPAFYGIWAEENGVWKIVAFDVVTP